jgi:PAS domain S-box-containing protein
MAHQLNHTTDTGVATLNEQALRASEDRFAIAFYSSPVAKAITTLAEGRYIEVNEAFEQQMGYTRAEICGRTSLELAVWSTPADRDAMVAALQRQKTVRNQAQFRTKSGALITTIYSASLITVDGQPCILAAILDVTAQKAAEDALRESEAKFRLLAETMLIGVFIYGEDGTFRYCNPQVEAFTGYSTEELRSLTVWDIVHPAFRDVVRTRAAARFRGDSAPSRSEIQILTKDGTSRWIDFSARLIEFQRKPAILCTAVDVTDAKRNELQLKEHATLLQTLVANSPFGIMVGGKDHRVTFCNAAFQRMFLYTADEVVGRDPDELVGLPENTEATDISRRVQRGEVVRATTARRRKDGRRIDVELHAIPLLADNEFIGCFGIYHDITERVEAEAKLRALRGRLTRVQDEERAHVARELHDNIGQRLALLGLHLAELRRTASETTPHLIQQIETSATLTEELTGDVERLSRRMHPSQLTYLGLTRALSGLCEEFARQNAMTIDFDHGEVPKLPPDITMCIYRVVQEAIRNAQRHSGSRRVRVELFAGADAVRLAVSDEGRGFDVATEHGSGLGLVSMTERVRGLDGELAIRSRPEEGTRIEASIPLPHRE